MSENVETYLRTLQALTRKLSKTGELKVCFSVDMAKWCISISDSENVYLYYDATGLNQALEMAVNSIEKP